ncbi:hypothetical protein K8I85_11790, partial [bacterium]|nr:hypothetical protein [bacterium]
AACAACAIHAAQLATDPPHGARRGSLLAASVVAMVLCVALAAREPIAAALHDTSTKLHGKELRLIPLALCNAAARLDGSRPVYLAETISLNEELGRSAAARDARATLRARAAEFESASRGAAIPVVLSGSAGEATTAWARLQPLTTP